MSCCTNTIYKFCKAVNPCDLNTFKALFIGMGDGSYFVALPFQPGGIQHISFTKSGSEITFASDVLLNENFHYEARILNTLKEPVPFLVATEPFDAFQFETKPFKQ